MAVVLAPVLMERPRSRRRRLVELDRLAAHLTGLDRIRAVVGGASAVVTAGWVQHGWFSEHDGRAAACLVGAVVHAGGGPAALRTQPVQRALDLTWHALHGDPDGPVRWCPAPAVRALHVRELTHWNDDRRRTADDVTRLLARADALARTEIDQTRRTRAALADASAGLTVDRPASARRR